MFTIRPLRKLHSGLLSLGFAQTCRQYGAYLHLSSSSFHIWGLAARGLHTRTLPLFTKALEFSQDPRRLAIVDSQGQHTYGDLVRDVTRGSQVLKNSAPGHKLNGERVAFLCPNGYDYVVVQWSVWAAGGIAVPLSSHHPLAELAYFLEDSQASILVYHPQFEGIVSKLPSSVRDRCVALNSQELMSCTSTPLAPLPAWNSNLDARAMIIYTSGTTGRPKGVVTTHRNIAAQVGALVNAWGWSPNDRIYHSLPLHHIHGVINALNCGLASGATVEMAPKFRADQAWQRWTDPDSPPISLFMAVPAMYSKLLQAYDGMGGPAQDQARAACGQFRLMVSGSSALPQPLFRRWREVSGHTLLERYGMTEIGMALSNPADTPGQRVEGSVGFPLSGVKVCLVDSGGRDITDQPDVSGELLVAGDAVFQEYWNRPDATRAAFLLSDDGTRWFKTGDTASVGHASKSGSSTTDSSLPPGYWRILGRNSQDILKSGGYKLSALEIERQLLAHPQVADVAVVGVPDETLGQTVAAIVQVAPPETNSVLMADTILSPGALVEFCRPRMARYKFPRTWRLTTEDIPRNAMGKVNKKDLVRLYFPDEVSAATTKS